MSGSKRRHAAKPLGALFTIALLLRLRWAWGDLEALLRYATSDDAYYYFQIARNWVAGNGVSLDATTLTNGFHPLWLVFVAAGHLLSDNAEIALRLGLSLGALLGAGSVLLLYRVIERLTASHVAALFGAALYAVHPTAITESVNGLETALAVFTTAALIERFLVLTQSGAPPDRRSLVLFGAAGGALLLARTDAVFLWAALLVALALRSAALRPALVAGAVSSVCVLPWFAWNQATFGSVMQVSASAIPAGLRADFLAEHGDALATQWTRSRFLLARAFGADLPHLYAIPRSLPVWPAGIATAAALALTLRSGAARAAFARLLPALGGVFFTLVWHAGVRWWTREWYFAPAGWLCAVAVGVCVAALLHRLQAARGGRTRAGLATLAGASLFALALPPVASHWLVRSEHRVQQLEAADWLATRTAPDARIGAFNAGIYSYFSGRRVVNLDGAVNADAVAARRAGRLLDYALESGIDHLVDWRGTLPMLGCAQRDDVACERIAVIGEPLPGFAGSPIWVLELSRAHAPATP